MRLLLTAALLLLPACAAGAAAPPKAIEDKTRRAIYDRVTDGSSPEEIAEIPAWMKQTAPKMFRKVDIDGDRLADWHVDYQHAPNASYFCGSGGCLNILYRGLPDGTYAQVFSHVGGDLIFKGGHRLEINFHGSACGSFGADECLRAWRWDNAAGRYLETANSKGQTFLPSGSIPALYSKEADAPAAVRAEIDARRAACRAAGGDLEEAIFRDLPDINGDGARDWLVGSPYSDCDFRGEDSTKDPGPRLTILASDGTGFVTAFDRKDAVWNLDLARTPATVVLTLTADDCGLGEKACPTQPLTWDPASKTLK